MKRSIALTAAVLAGTVTLVGCFPGIPEELTKADQAIAAAKQAGKDKDCPELYKEAEALKNMAFALCKPCDQTKAIALAKESLDKSKKLCPPKPTPPPPPPPPVVVNPAPTVAIAATPAEIKEGACTALNWTSTNAKGATIDQTIGAVDANGSKQVCPTVTTTYAIVATGAGGSANASTTVNVKPRVIDRLVLHTYFDFDKADLKPADQAELEKGRTFLKKYPGFKIHLEGHTDSIGPDAYNQKLSERRANAVKSWLVGKGIEASKITTQGFGKTKPVADNKTKKGRAENRRVEILVLSE